MTDEKEKKGAEQPEGKDPEKVDEKSFAAIEKAEKVAERLEAANTKTEQLILRQERLAVEKTLGGTSSAGQPQEPPEISDKEYADKVMKGEIRDAKEE